MEELKNKEQELFRNKPDENGETEEKLKTLSSKVSMLHQTITSITDCNNEDNLEYFSKLYGEVKPLIENMKDYVEKNEYGGQDKRFDDLVSKIYEVEEFSKVLRGLLRNKPAEKHIGEMEEKLKTLSSKFSMLHQTITSITDCNNEDNLEYFSKLYGEVKPLIENMKDYVEKNEYGGQDERFDDIVSKVYEVEEFLKVLHLRYGSLKLPPKSDHLSWWEYSQKGNKEILREVKTRIEKMKTILEGIKVLLGEPKVLLGVV